jgi:hypothetical protein
VPAKRSVRKQRATVKKKKGSPKESQEKLMAMRRSLGGQMNPPDARWRRKGLPQEIDGFVGRPRTEPRNKLARRGLQELVGKDL